LTSGCGYSAEWIALRAVPLKKTYNYFHLIIQGVGRGIADYIWNMPRWVFYIKTKKEDVIVALSHNSLSKEDET
jgi:hypothetical protein